MPESLLANDFQSVLDEVRDIGSGPPPLTPSPADWRDQAIYFLMLDRFNNRLRPPKVRFDDPNFVDFQGGNFRGVKEQLPYLKDLGVGAIWLSPALRNLASETGTYHGYGIHDFLRAEPRFAEDPNRADEELLELVDEAHKKGLFVIFDIVLNHIGNAFLYDCDPQGGHCRDSAGRTVSYSYDGSGRLNQVNDANGGVWNYTYDINNNMLTIQDPRSIYYLSNQYDANNRVIQQTGPDNKNSYFSYITDQNNNVRQSAVTDPRGIIEQLTFDANGYITTDVLAQGQPEQQTVTYTRDPNTELVTAAVDPLNRETDYVYDSNGNVTSITRLAHTGNAVSTSFTYDPTRGAWSRRVNMPSTFLAAPRAAAYVP
jgi:YD repeat-containing protein